MKMELTNAKTVAKNFLNLKQNFGKNSYNTERENSLIKSGDLVQLNHIQKKDGIAPQNKTSGNLTQMLNIYHNQKQ